MKLFKAAIAAVKKTWAVFTGALGDTREALASIVMMFIYKGTIEGSQITSIDFLDWLITVGMLIIIWYGVLKIATNILWRFLFGKQLEWKIGILELFFAKLKPIYAQKVADMTDEELEETTDKYVDRLHILRKKLTKDNTRRCCKLEKLKGLIGAIGKRAQTNLKTNTAIGTIGALVLTAGGYLLEAKGILPVGEFLGVNLIDMLAVEAVAAVGLVAPGILGAGYQKREEFEAMKEAKKLMKVNKKEAKGQPKAFDPKLAAQKLAKKLKISEAAALQIVQQQQVEKATALKKAQAAKETMIVEKLAKKLSISVEQARKVRADQLAQKNKPQVK